MRKHFVGLLCFFGVVTLVLVWCSRGPDFDLHFVREVPSSLTPSHLNRHISAPNRWPQWFYSLNRVETPLQTPLTSGEVLTLKMDPGKGLRKQFEITAKITDYVPSQRIHFEILKDSSGRINRIFDHLNWDITLFPRDNGTLIRGVATARTAHWRARLLGRIAERILMNQVFYPDLLKLSELRQPFSVDSPLESQGVGWR